MELRLEQRRDSSLVKPTGLLKELNSVCSLADLMVMQMVLMTEMDWVLQTV